MPGRGSEVRCRTTGRSWKAIVDSLGNPRQQKIVADDREQTNFLVLAGPGSGKTRVLVHRIAYLIRVRRQNLGGILVLSYNRYAADEIRVRLRHLIGEDANGVTVSTCHSLAMRLVGACFAVLDAETRDFDGVVKEAARLLRGDGLTPAEAEAQRDRLIQLYRWILVDEYQDIWPERYELIAAVAGRTVEDSDARLSLFAVGDDDQNIYAFAGASIDYIRAFEKDYRAHPELLIENYRSTANIIQAGNAVIAPANERMKARKDIAIARVLATNLPGGDMEGHDPVVAGRVQILDCPPGDVAQGAAALDELERLSRLDPDWSWSKAAVMARGWRALGALRVLSEARGIPVELANEKPPGLWRMREMRAFIASLHREPACLYSVAALLGLLQEQPPSRWTDLIAEGIGALANELGSKSMPVPDLIEWFGEWTRDARGEQRGLLLLTAHRAKGLEFDHVIILDGGWERPSKGEDADAPRWLYYVAMTRARGSLAMIDQGRNPFLSLQDGSVIRRNVMPERTAQPDENLRYQMPDRSMVDLSWAGRLREGNSALADIAAARPGDPLSLQIEGKCWMLRNAHGRVVGRMSARFIPPESCHFLRGEIGAVVRWRKIDNAKKWRSSVRRDAWETILPELVFTSSVG